MTTKIIANYLFAETDENDVVMIGFADDEFETKDYILLQKSLASNEQNKELGFDKIHVTYCDQTRSTYGDILNFILKNGVIEITLDAKTANEIGTDESIEISFTQNDQKLANVKQQLAKMFANDQSEFVSEV